MFSIKKPSSRLKLALFIATPIVICAALALYYTETHHITDFIKNPFYKATPSMTAQQKEQATKNDPTTSTSAKADSQPASGVNKSQTTDQVPVSTTSSVAITNLSQTNGNVNITATITNPATSGVCTATFTKSGAKPVVRTINTSNNTCSASISELEFSMVGDWQVQVDYFANNTQATATGTITIK